MKKFLAIYTGTAESMAHKGWNKMDPAERKAREAAGMKAWGDWMQANAAAIVDPGGPLGRTKRADAGGISDSKNGMTGYVIVQAESHDAAAKLFTSHPHFAIFPGDAVEIMECPPMPGR